MTKFKAFVSKNRNYILMVDLLVVAVSLLLLLQQNFPTDYKISASFGAAVFILDILLVHFLSEKHWTLCFILTFLTCVVLCWLSIEYWNTTFFFNPEVGLANPEGGVKSAIARMVINFTIILCLFLFLTFIIRNLKAGMTVTTLFINILGVIGSALMKFRGTIFTPADLLSLDTAREVAGQYHFVPEAHDYLGLVFTIMALTAIWILPSGRFPATWSRLKKRIIRGCAIGVSLVLTLLFFVTDSDQYYYAFTNTVNGYPYAFATNLKLLKVQKPKNYNEKKIPGWIEQGGSYKILDDYDAGEAIKSAFPEYYEKYGAKPVVIGIMNESFSDLSVLGDMETNVPVTPYLDELKDEMIWGHLYTEVFGGGTSDTEYSFLTGNSTFLFSDNIRAYQLYIKEQNSSFAKNLKNEGYQTYAIHPMSGTNWNRESVYPLLGFDKFYTIDDFKDPELVRGFVSDAETYKKIESIIEDTEGPVFTFDVTMQGHGGYVDKDPNLKDVHITNLEGDTSAADIYLSSINNSDDAFADLITYLRTVNEPVVVCMFGDHQPQLGEAFSSLISGKSKSQWNIEDLQKQQITPFYIWANYEIPTQEIERISINYLGSLFINCTGTKMTPYQHYLSWLYKQLPVLDRIGVITNSGKVKSYYDLTDEESMLVQEYRDIIYNNVFDIKNRQSDLYTLPNTTSKK